MKRIKYISEFSKPMGHADIAELTRRSAERNAHEAITGMLVASGDLFFQLLEGPDAAVDAVFSSILGDDRHKNVLVLGVEQGDLRRMCPDWAMNKLDLSAESSIRFEPLRAILRALVAQSRVAADLSSTLETSMIHELIAAETEALGKA